jgi:S-adenosylmethionine synthetase
MPEPINLGINTFHTNIIEESHILTWIKNTFPLNLQEIVDHFQLTTPNFHNYSAFGHFIEKEKIQPWEKTDKVVTLKEKMSQLK